jgi:hypothetical protein
MRGFKIAHSKLGKHLRNARAHLSRLLNQRRDALRWTPSIGQETG